LLNFFQAGIKNSRLKNGKIPCGNFPPRAPENAPAPSQHFSMVLLSTPRQTFGACAPKPRFSRFFRFFFPTPAAPEKKSCLWRTNFFLFFPKRYAASG
jgi:hypothetical protein